MANAVAEGMKEAGVDVSVMTATEAASLDPSTYDGLAFGCPAMGSEVLEESEFQPMWMMSKENCPVNPSFFWLLRVGHR